MNTGLEKICPRCDRRGVVMLRRDDLTFDIEWDGPPRSGCAKDRDSMVRIDNLVDPALGCGYDRVTLAQTPFDRLAEHYTRHPPKTDSERAQAARLIADAVDATDERGFV